MNETEIRANLTASSNDQMDAAMVAVYRSKTPTERLQIAFSMYRSGQKIVAAAVKHQLPDATDEERQREVARRISHGLI